MYEEKVSTLVVGAGLAGLSTAMFLAGRGVHVVLVEKRPSTSIFPRAVGQNARTMELFQFGGVADAIRGLTQSPSKLTVRAVSSMRGPAVHEEVYDAELFDSNVASPAGWAMAGQQLVEPVLRARAEELGADLRFDTELVSFDQDDEAVTVTLRDRGTGRTSQVRADYLVAADGNRSPVREALGIGRHGPGTLSQNMSIIFEADLGDLVDPANPTMFFLRNDLVSGVVATYDYAANLHLVATQYDPAAGESAEDFTTERCVELIRAVTELPELSPVVHAVQKWEMAAAVADEFRRGRVFLAGDAAKVTAPTGGFGGNTAVGDAFDIAWKLAAVLNGKAGPGLLDSYQAERQPIAEQVIAEALGLQARRAGTADTSESEASRAAALTLGFRYRSGAVLAEDVDGEPTENPFEPSGRPGFRAPHVWLQDKVSTVDYFGHDWVLLTADTGSWQPAATRLGVTMVTADSQEFLSRYGISETGASLVRPDGVVAWRSTVAPDDPAAILSQVFSTLVDQDPVAPLR